MVDSRALLLEPDDMQIERYQSGKTGNQLVMKQSVMRGTIAPIPVTQIASQSGMVP
jgi:hypothetical protein